MDYTLSPDYATHAGTGNRMHEENAAVTTVWSEKDANSVIWSLMEVVKAGGLAGAQFDEAVPATYQKLLTALRSAGVFTTPAQFDSTTKAATSAFVQRAMGNFQNNQIVSAPLTLVATDVGKSYSINAGGSITLPLGATVGTGSAISILSTINGATITAQGGNTIYANTPSSGSITLNQLDSIVLVWNGVQWISIGGSAILKGSSQFGASIAESGYQKLPSGIILQWGIAITQAGGTVVVNRPLVYPTQVLHQGCSLYMGTVNSPYIAGIDYGSASQLTLFACTTAGVGQTGVTVKWYSVGS